MTELSKKEIKKLIDNFERLKKGTQSECQKKDYQKRVNYYKRQLKTTIKNESK